ncbi:MAG: hypothetical protein GXP55_07905, partial [Deltaproteobacteria bacterium]|nr:hypothetical protein [Deltaproteobacteria bacterium]
QTTDAQTTDAASDARGQLDPALDVRGGACAASPSAGVAPWVWLLALLLVLYRRRRPSRFVGEATLWLLVLAPLMAPAVAHADGFRLDRYRAPPLPEDLLWLERAAPRLRADGAFSRVSIVYADDPLVLGPGSPDAGRSIVSEQLALSLSVGFSAWRRLHVSVAMPVWFQRGDLLEATPGLQRPASPAAGDPVVDVRAVLLDRGAPLELSLALSATIPVGNSAAYAADDGPTFTPRLALGLPFGRLGSFVGLNLGATLRPPARLGVLHVGSELIFALGARIGLTERIAGTIELAGSSVLSRAFDPRHTPLEASVGMRYEHEAGVVLGTGIGVGLSPGYGAPDLRVLFTVGYRYTQGTSTHGQARGSRGRPESFATSAGTSYGRVRSTRAGDHDVGT